MERLIKSVCLDKNFAGVPRGCRHREASQVQTGVKLPDRVTMYSNCAKYTAQAAYLPVGTKRFSGDTDHSHAQVAKLSPVPVPAGVR